MNNAVKVVVNNRITELKESIRMSEDEINKLNKNAETILRRLNRAKFNIKNYREEKEELEKELLEG